jgi:RNA-directed DNA polymerase
MEKVVAEANLRAALQRVKQNKGAPGIDGVTVAQLDGRLQEQGDHLREQLLAGNYRPQPVRRVEIPKPQGGVRLLGFWASPRWWTE